MTVTSISSDHHCHLWSQFSRTGADGVNSRLRTILDELERQAQTLKAAGGDKMFLAGDLFHVRGSVSPEVLNPTMDAFRRICESGIDVYCIAGNHDLSTKDSSKLGNSMQALHDIDGFCAIVEPELVDDSVMMIPWIEELDELRAVAIKNANPNHDLIIHAPLNGVIKGIPDHGLEAAEVAAWGYRRVFVGHYHFHKEFDGGIYSVGATSHQTWSDPGTLAGFLMVTPTEVTHHESNAPKFVNIDCHADIGPHIKDSFCRLRFKDATAEDLKKVHETLKANGAAGVVDHSTKKREITRGVVTKQNVTLEVSVANYVKDHHASGTLSKKRIAVDALDVLRQARTVGDE